MFRLQYIRDCKCNLYHCIERLHHKQDYNLLWNQMKDGFGKEDIWEKILNNKKSKINDGIPRFVLVRNA